VGGYFQTQFDEFVLPHRNTTLDEAAAGTDSARPAGSDESSGGETSFVEAGLSGMTPRLSGIRRRSGRPRA